MSKTSFFFSFLVFIISYVQAGFTEGTLIKTSEGFSPIEEICIGDLVYSYCDKDDSFALRKVKCIANEEATRLILIKANNNHIFADNKQRFYLPIEKRWRSVKNLRPGDILQSCYQLQLMVESVEEVAIEAIAYDLTIEDYHTFCITGNAIVAHNIVIAFPLLVWGAGEVALASGIGGAVLASIAAALYIKALEETTGANADHVDPSKADFCALKGGCVEEPAEPGIICGTGGNVQPWMPTKPCVLDTPNIPDGYGLDYPGIQDVIGCGLPGNFGVTDIEPCRLTKPSADDQVYSSKNKNPEPKVPDPNGAQAPGMPTEKDGFKPPKNWDGQKQPAPESLLIQ